MERGPGGLPAVGALTSAIRPIAALLLVSLAFLSLPGLSPVRAAPNPGTLDVLDDADADDPGYDPHLACGEFWVRGRGLAVDEGTLTFSVLPPTAKKAVVGMAAFAGDDGDFLAGPFVLEPGHYQVEADGQRGMHKVKAFWIDECGATPTPTATSTGTSTSTETATVTSTETGTETVTSTETETQTTTSTETGTETVTSTETGTQTVTSTETATETTTSTQTSTSTDTATDTSTSTGTSSVTTTSTSSPDPTPPACPADVTAMVMDDARIIVAWTPVPDTDGTRVWRAADGGDFELLATVPAPQASHSDADLTDGTAYTYRVDAVQSGTTPQDCPVAEAAAVPEFTTLASFALAMVGAIAPIAWHQRRKR